MPNTEGTQGSHAFAMTFLWDLWKVIVLRGIEFLPKKKVKFVRA